MRLKDKTALVTGGASGFGAGIARAFAAEGARVMVADINADGAGAIAAEIGGAGCHVDVSDAKSVEQMGARTLDTFGTLDILVNNAGITHARSPLEDVSEDDFDRVFSVNMKSVFLTARALVPHFKERQGGVILNIASTAGISPRAHLNWYNASKGWMITATKTMAVELAGDKIRVNALCPVAGETPLLPAFLGEDSPAARERFLATIPIGRFSTPEDLGASALFLCADEASMITGVALEVDGGRCI